MYNKFTLAQLLQHRYVGICLVLAVLIIGSCKTTKKKSDVSGITKFYHNTTAYYNGFFNARVLLEDVKYALNNNYQENFNQLLPIEKYMGSPHYKSMYPKLDTAIKKVSVISSVHRMSVWTDDCYLLAGKAQYIKHDFEAAEKTLEYLVKEFNPANPESQYWKFKDRPKKVVKKGGKKRKISSTELRNQYESTARGDGGMGRNPALNRGRLWLARVLIERDLIGQAQMLINEVQNNFYPSEELKNLIHTTQAMLYIHEKRHERAARELSSAINYAPDRQHKARYAFITAQLYELSGDAIKANIYYEKARKYAISYEMIFHAKLNQLKSSFANNKQSLSSTLKDLEKMTKDEKNSDHLDVLYYTMAEIYKLDKDYDAALKHYKMALSHKSNTSTVIVESYMEVAMLYYGKDKFIQADNYLDSCLNLMNPLHENYDRLKELADKIDPIAQNLRIITETDSLIAISQMSPEEQRELAAKIKASQKDKKLNPGNITQGTKGMRSLTLGGRSVPGSGPGVGGGMRYGKYQGSFFAYQKDSKKDRKRVFEKKWGDIPLVDNWRVSSLIDFSQFPNHNSDEKQEKIDPADLLTEAEIQKILEDVPKTDRELTVAKAKIKEAMLELGFLYRSRLDRSDLTIKILEELLERFPHIRNKLEAYYNLYLAYNNVNRKGKAQEYKELIIKEYPGSSIARSLKNPDYAAEQKSQLHKLALFYESTFKAFEDGDYTKAHNMVTTAFQNFGAKNKYAGKFALLDAMAIGKIKGEMQYVQALKDVVNKYKGTDVELRATEILRFLNGADHAFSGEKTTGNFVIDDKKIHYILVVINNPNKINKRQAKISVAEFNEKYFRLDKLKVSSIYLNISDNSSPILIVRSFEDKKDAMRYYGTALQFEKDFLPVGADFDIYAANQVNYREILSSRTIVTYRDFFEKHYLKK